MSQSIFSMTPPTAAAAASSSSSYSAAMNSQSSHAPTAAASSSSSSFRRPAPSAAELDKLIMRMEVAGVMVDEKRSAQVALLARNDYDWLRAVDDYFAGKAEDDEDSEDNMTNGSEIEEQKNGSDYDMMHARSAQRPALNRAATSMPAAAAAAAASSSTPAPTKTILSVRNDSSPPLILTYTQSYHKTFARLMENFTEQSKRKLEYFYKGRPISESMTPLALGMQANDTIEARAPARVKRNFGLSDIAGMNAASTASSQANDDTVSPSASAAAAVGLPAMKRAKSDPLSGSSSFVPLPSPPPARPSFEILLGSLNFTLMQPRTIVDKEGKRILSAAPQSIYSSLNAFLKEKEVNQWVSWVVRGERPAIEEMSTLTPEQQEAALAVQRTYEDTCDAAHRANDLVVSALESWHNKSSVIKCFIKCLSKNIECPCGTRNCSCEARVVSHAFHVSVSLLGDAHNQHIPHANAIFPLLHADLKLLIDDALPQRNYPIGAKMELGNLLELAVRTKFSHCQNDIVMEEDTSAVAPAAASSSSSSASASSSRRSRSRKHSADMMDISSSTSTAAASSSSALPVLNQHQRIRQQWGLDPDEKEPDLRSPATNHLLNLSPKDLSWHCGVNLTLRDYQQQTVLWAAKQESLSSMSEPYWHETELSARKVWYSTHFQAVRFEPPTQIVGGMICEEMGLGKTIEMLALIHLNPAKPINDASSMSSSSPFSLPRASSYTPSVAGLTSSSCTLIIVPTSLVGQWMSEIVRHSHASRELRVGAWYGPHRFRQVEKVHNFDVLLTTSTIVKHEFSKKSGDTLLAKIDWHRIIVDESHTLKNKSQQAKHIMSLHSHRRWLLTGTPLSSSVEDIFGQFAFFDMPILSHDSHISAAVRKHVFRTGYSRNNHTSVEEKMYPASRCYDILITMFTESIMRHTKTQPFNGRAQLITLPKRTTNIVRIPFTPDERARYDELKKYARAQFEEFKKQGQAVAKVMQVMALLMPLRRACSYGKIDMERVIARLKQIQEEATAKEKEKKSKAAAAAEDSQPFNSVDGDCSICLDTITDALMALCKHVFCGECIQGCARALGTCPLCRAEVRLKELKPPPAPIIPVAAAATAAEEEQKDSLLDNGSSMFKSKVDALIQQLRVIRTQDETVKSIVFSQFTDTIHAVEKRLREEGFGVVVLVGSDDANHRKAALDRFVNDDEYTIFVMSIRSGSVGLTLTRGQHVFIMEPQTNPAQTLQAINRVHRVGQTKEVFIHHLVMADSIDEKILAMTQSKLEASVETHDLVKMARENKESYRMREAELTALFA